MPQETVGGEAQSDDRCCENPHVVAVPTRRFKDPESTHRETAPECVNCGAYL